MMTRNTSLRLLSLLGLAATLAACGDDDRPMGAVDAGMLEVDSGGPPPGDAGAVVMCEAPPGPYGTSVGRLLEPFTLQNCADGSDYSFYNEEWCDSTFTVISIAAGWCPPCIMESSQLTEAVTEAYRDRGVRVIQILIQTDDYSAPSLAYCNDWVDNFGLTNVELIDPDQITQIYFPGNSLPSTIIVDSEGMIRFRENGATDGLVSLTSKLDELLAEM